MKEIVIATRNRHKFDEIREILTGLNCKLLFAGDYPDIPEVEEDSNLLLVNALDKAKEVAKYIGKPCIADDTGLFVRYLGNRPGAFAARYAGPGCSYEDNVNKLLDELTGITDRHAIFVTMSVYYDPVKNIIDTAEGIVEGEIVDQRRGEGGFGYDPIFKPAGQDLTYAQMTDEVKNKLSHRYLSLQKLIEKIKDKI